MSEEINVAEVRDWAPNGTDEPQVVPPPPAPEPQLGKSLAQALEKLNEKVDVSTNTARLLADPDVRELLAAKQAGKKVRVVGDDEVRQVTQPQAVDEPEPDLESLSNADLVKYLQKKIVGSLEQVVQGTVSQQVQALKGELSPAVEELTRAHQARLSGSVNEQIEKARQKYQDFSQMQPKMVEVNQSVQGLTIDELYWLAKIRSGVPVVPQEKIETERPSRVPSERSRPSPGKLTGPQGFSRLLDQALKE